MRWQSWLAALVMLCAGCAAAAQTALPPPLVQVTAQPPAADASALPTGLAVLPTLTPLPQGLEELAQAAYGQRLIGKILIPALQVNAPVKPVGWQLDISAPDETVWDSPQASVGWAVTSALPGDDKLIFLYGHNNIDSSVFQHLYLLQAGDEITLQTGEHNWVYRAVAVDILPVGSLEESRAAVNAVFQTGEGERLVLLSCWPPDNNTHRVIVSAEWARTEE